MGCHQWAATWLFCRNRTSGAELRKAEREGFIIVGWVERLTKRESGFGWLTGVINHSFLLPLSFVYSPWGPSSLFGSQSQPACGNVWSVLITVCHWYNQQCIDGCSESEHWSGISHSTTHPLFLSLKTTVTKHARTFQSPFKIVA